ncbi:MAG: SDR family NAD(P)-dependent oxidoreductase [Polyangiaceae bacterium]|nr:SDR family NAD(P)-dependent oxidoreductase [Polyangiaceae bacterium]
MSELRFDGRVAIVTGAGGGLGRSHALLLGSRGCKVVVNDLGGSMHGGGSGDKTPAERVVAEIKAAGGEAVANYDSVENGDKIVQAAMDAYKRIDIIVNNAGILRDTSFQKMTDEDWDLIYRVHVLGSYKVTKAAWPHMRDAKYGRIIMTASAAGIYGNFGQANYAMAKMGIIGFAQTLALEGKKNNVFANTIAPIAGSRLTETVLPKEVVDALKPEVVSPLVAYLAHESCQENGGTFEVGGGFMAKLRWERSQGKTFGNGKPISIEQVQKAFGDITGFAKTTHPTNINESMQPILDNINKKSHGGNELIDVDAALGYEFPAVTTSYDERDLSLYALSIGAASNPLDEKEVAYAYEMSPRGFQPFPTYGVTPAIKALLDAARRGEMAPGLNYGFERVLHGEQYISVTRPLPPHAKLTHKAKIKEIWDKGKNAVVVMEMKSFDEAGELLIANELSMVVRGAGGWGGERGPASDANSPPERAADKVVEQKIDEHQALLYRLNGDWNPLHADPTFAKNFGFDKPILHGLCTFGYAARHAVGAFCDGDARLFKSIRARFADSVFPGETLITELWRDGDKVTVRCKVKERDKVVLSNGVVELYQEVPKPQAKPAAAPAAQASAAPAAASADAVTSKLLFDVIGFYVEKNPEMAGQIKTSFQFKLKGPDSAYYIDFKAPPGKVAAGELAGADVTLELSDADFIGMATGKLNPQKLYFGGQLKISGNVMASQKLEFLKKMDGQKLMQQMAAEGRLAAAAPAPAAAAAAAPAEPGKLTSADIFVAIRDYVEKNPDLATTIKTSFQFKLKSPESGYYLDLKSSPAKVEAGDIASPDVTLELTDEDFLAMTTGGADAQKLYFAGKLKIGGNVMASQKLMFLKKVDPKAAEAAIAKARAASGGAAAAAAPAAAKANNAPTLMKALGERLAKEPALGKEPGAVVAFKVDGSTWVVDGTKSPATVAEGDAKGAAAVMTISDDDLAELAKSGNARALFQHGKLKVEGDVRLAHRVGFIKGLA